MQVAEIKCYLKKNKITYEELSSRSGIPVGTLKNIFSKCTINPRIDTMQAIEEALGLNKPLDWTDDDIAAGVGRYPIYMSEDERRWFDLRSEIIAAQGEQYLETLIIMLEAITKQKK